MTSSSPNVAIGIATYRRPEQLAVLLASLGEIHYAGSVRVVVIDNDAEQSAREVCAEARLNVEYFVEATPGIAAARNAFLGETSPTDEWLVFVDDDEWVSPTWLDSLIRAAREYDADLVSGPVIPVFPDDAPRWAVDGGFFERARHTTGTKIELAATNNTLVRRASLFALVSPQFDTSFSQTGGSDTELTHRLRQSGARMVWCDEAVVSEEVPHSRLKWSWVVARATRTGEVRGRLLLRDRAYVRLVGESVARILIGGWLMALRAIRGSRKDARSTNMFYRGVGVMRALSGRLTNEYARSQ